MTAIPNRIKEVYEKSTCIYTRDEVESALDRMANDISVKLSDANPILLCVLIGGIVPMGKLLPRLNFHLEVDYVHVTRYHGATTGGEIQWKAAPGIQLKDRVVVVVDDILDGGLTLKAIVDYCNEQGAKKVYSAVLVEKEKSREVGGVETADFKGIVMDERFVFGYGLDYDNYLRNAPGIYAVAPEHV